jgi:hypothetical protein
MSFMDILKQYTNPSEAHSATSTAHFDEVAQSANPAVVGEGVAAAFRSDQTPPFPDMVAKLFGQSNSQQQAGVVNQLLGSINPAMLSTLAGGVLGRLGTTTGTGSAPPTLTPAQASQLTPDQVQVIAAHARQHDTGIMDKIGSFYGEHPQLVKSLGGMALALVLGKMASKS